jgi:uncharacterized protein YndB with AHSA1/START domain
MNNLYNIKTITVNLQKLISAPAEAIFVEWINPDFPGSPWNGASKVLLEAKRDGFFYRKDLSENKDYELVQYGRFLIFEPGLKLKYTWVSQETRGLESFVSVILDDQVDQTLITIIHENLPDDEKGRMYKVRWEQCLERFEGLAKWQVDA